MLVMFALGVASLIWMALLTALGAREDPPTGVRTVPVTGVTLLAVGTTLFLTEHRRRRSPGTTITLSLSL